MPSPFPGIDPYFETEMGCGDFRHGFIVHLSDALHRLIPEHYVARINRREFLVDPDFILPRRLMFRSDERPARIPNTQIGDPHRELFIEIREVTTGQIVTVIEFLSPANKNGGRGQYLERRQALLRQSVNLIEIDLTRGGVRPLFEFEFAPNSYCFLVSPANDRPYTLIYEWTVRDPIPRVPVPLKTGEPVVQLDVSSVIQLVRERGRYESFINYTKPPPAPPFEHDDATWVEQLARTRMMEED